MVRRRSEADRVTAVKSIGGIYIYARDPKGLAEWYREHLGIDSVRNSASGARYRDFYYREPDDPELETQTVWGILPAGEGATPEPAGFQVTYRVDDLGEWVERLAAQGVEIERVEDHACGRSAWIRDPDGRSIELWED